MSEKSYYKYIHNNTSEDTVLKFFGSNLPLTKDIFLVDFLKYRGDNEQQNIERIFNKYTKLEQKEYEETYLYIRNTKPELLRDNIDFLNNISTMPLKMNTLLFIPNSGFKSEFISIQGKDLFLKQNNDTIFFWEKLYNLLSDPDYVKSEDLSIYGRDLSTEIINENLRIWIWSRALNKIINISPFVVSASTNKSDIGSFSIQLNPIKDIDDVSFLSGEEIINFFNLNEDNQNNLDFFYKNLQYNDIVFIRFEKLKMDENIKDSFLNNLEAGAQQLPNQVWDMIGLIDDVSQSSLYSGVTDYLVSISGRDLMKLLVEDGSYDMKLRLLSNGDNILFGTNREDKWFKRNVGDKESGKNDSGTFDQYHFPNSDRSIGDTVGFIINQLSNLGVTEDSLLFAYYKDKRTKQYSISNKLDSIISVNEVNGIWQIIKVFLDDKLNNRRVIDDSISYVDSTIFEQFNRLCQKPFVEFFGDTYGDQFNFIVRQPPFTKDSITSFLNGVYDGRDQFNETNNSLTVTVNKISDYKVITLDEKDVDGYNNMRWENTYYSWYQIFPNNKIYGSETENVTGGYIPIVYFDRIAQIFGNHRMIINDNYIDSDSNNYINAVYNDLKFIIDTNSYLPFTRKGTITIPKGDRRIKRGTFIRITPTDEIFYVDSVSHNISFSNNSVNRSTTINVSRGMLEKYINGSVGYDNDGRVIFDKGQPSNFSYFKIITAEVLNGKLYHKLDNVQLDFFLKRMQFNKYRLK